MSDPVDRLLDDFDAAWQGSSPPRLEDFVPPPGSPGRASVLLDLIHIDLERRLKRGDAVRVEEYLARYPELMGDESAVLGLMRTENELRQRATSAPTGRHEPARLGEYELVRELGKGGIGVVYEARNTLLDRPVAIKVLGPAWAGDAAAVARFRREMLAGGRLDHPHLVRYTHAGESEGRLFLVMELLDGIDLARHVKQNGPLSIAEACGYASQAAAGLQYAHEQGLVHRDVKPNNLFLTAAGVVKVLDLGLARLRGGSDMMLTAANSSMGTPDYMSPEQWENAHLVDTRADVYGLGCTLYHLLTGKPPFADCADTSAKRKAHRYTPPP